MVPIWKDYFAVFPLQVADFRVLLSGTPIYAGRAVAKPGATSVSVRINDICAGYLAPQPIDFDAALNETAIARSFVVQYKNVQGTWLNYATVEFQNDWSYDPTYVVDRDGLNFPISDFVDARQRLLFTRTSGNTVRVTIVFDGSSIDVALPVRRTNDFNNDFNNDFSRSTTQLPGVAVLDIADYPGAKAVIVDGRRIDMEVSCHRYALYYVNAVGGWDTLLLRGNGVEEDEWERSTYGVAYDNRDRQARGTVDYLNSATKRWRIHTGWLTDLGASRMHHLVGSTLVYLHDMEQDAFMPVLVTTTTAPVKTYRNEGGKLIDYELEVTLAQERLRR